MKSLAALAALLLAAAPLPAALTAPEQRMVRTVDAANAGDKALLRRMVDINSGTRNLAGVTKMAGLMRAELEPLGFAVRWTPMPATGRAGVLVAEHRGSGRGTKMLLIGHLDTVFEADSPFQRFVDRGDTVEGPGVNDMKGGLVIMLSALRAMKAAGTLAPADIRIVLSGDEEAVGRPVETARADLVAAGKWADAAFEFEGLAQENGRDMGSIARRGSVSWKLRTTGKAAHSSGVFSDAVGFGANYELARILDAFRRELREPNLTYNVGLVLGGAEARTATDEAIAGTASGKPNIVAGQAIATGDIRALSNEQAARVQAKMQAIVAQHLPGTGGGISFDEGYPAMAPTPGSRALLAALNGVNADLGLATMAELDPLKRGAGDIAFVAGDADGLIGLGAAGQGSHAVGETAEWPSFARQAKRAAILLSRLAVTPYRPVPAR